MNKQAWNMRKFWLAIATMLMLVVPMARAEIVAEWHAVSNYTSGSVRYFRMPPYLDNGGTRTWLYSLETPISPDVLYYDGPEFFGALEITMGSGTPSDPYDRCVRGNNNGELRFWAPNTADGFNNYMRGLIFFQPELRPGQAIGKLRAGNSLSITLPYLLGIRKIFRMALLCSGTWYLSETYSAGSFTLENLDQQMWGPWNPDGSPLDDTPGTYDVPGSALTEIQAVGFYFDIAETRGLDGRGVRMSMHDFTADLTLMTMGTTLIVH